MRLLHLFSDLLSSINTTHDAESLNSKKKREMQDSAASTYQRAQAIAMHRVSATKHSAFRGGVEEVLLAHRAVLMHRTLDAAVVISEFNGIAAPTRITMEKLVTPAHSANATAFTVKRLFVQVVVEEITDAAEIVSKNYSASIADTDLRDRLAHAAGSALHLAHCVSVQFMSCRSPPTPLALILICIVTESAPKSLTATRCD